MNINSIINLNNIWTNSAALISLLVGLITILIWLSRSARVVFLTYKNRIISNGVYYCAWVDPIKEEINFSIAKLTRVVNGFTIKVLYLHKSRYNYTITLKPYKKNSDIFHGWWNTKQGNTIYQGPMLFRYTNNGFIGKWLGPKENHNINGGLFLINYISTSNNKYIKFKTNKIRYWINNTKIPRFTSIIKSITKKHDDNTDNEYQYKDIVLDIPKHSFHPKFGKISEKLLEYVKTCTARNSDVLDLGTGAGFYAIALAKTLNCKVKGVDINTRDINIASSNASKNSVSHLTFFQTVCAYDPYESIESNEKFDIIIANLPFSRLSKIWFSRKHPMSTCFYGSRCLLERLILGSAYHVKLNGKLIFAYAESGYKNYIEDLIDVSPWKMNSVRLASESKDDKFYIYDLRLKDEFVSLVETNSTDEQKKTALALQR